MNLGRKTEKSLQGGLCVVMHAARNCVLEAIGTYYETF